MSIFISILYHHYLGKNSSKKKNLSKISEKKVNKKDSGGNFFLKNFTNSQKIIFLKGNVIFFKIKYIQRLI